MLTKEQLAFRKQWVAALRSGRVEQARIGHWPRGSMCVLNIAGEIAGMDTVEKLSGLPLADRTELMHMNDGRHGRPQHTFGELADTIELLTLADQESA